jgi:hypothetical protein
VTSSDLGRISTRPYLRLCRRRYTIPESRALNESPIKFPLYCHVATLRYCYHTRHVHYLTRNSCFPFYGSFQFRKQMTLFVYFNISKHQIGYRDLRQAIAATVAPGAPVDASQILVDICSFCCLFANLLMFPYFSSVIYQDLIVHNILGKCYRYQALSTTGSDCKYNTCDW